VLSKHKVTKAELAILSDTLKSGSKVSISKGVSKVSESKVRSVAKVPPKYKSPAGLEIWTGRGRSPNWVTHLCGTEVISVEEFKQNSKYAV
jgi:DNA-binding protein H-NS